jgi:UDP-glucose 4-epimerase
MRKKILVFGGNGFIGSYLIEELVGRGHQVISADLQPSEYVDASLFETCDILDPHRVEQLVKGVDVVYNFAGMANLDTAVENPVKAVELNVLGNINILEACRKYHIARFIYASSAYAMSDKGSFYGISKLTSEKLVEEYYKQYGLKFTIIRYGSIYGERDYDNNYIYNLVKKAMLTGEINHNGDGEEIREYIHAADVARLASDVMESDEFINEHLILTGVERMQRRELFEMINEMLGNRLKIDLNNDGYQHHYKITPYSFHPTRSKKLVANPYIDLGQGVLDCMNDIHEKSEGRSK